MNAAATLSGPPPRSLAKLLNGIAEVPGGKDVFIADIALDSRAAQPGGAFLACRGIKSHGLQYVDAAVKAGVSVVLWEPTPDVAEPKLPASVLGLPVKELSHHLGRIADRFFDSPSKHIRIAGVTGTNGKTTSAYLLAQAFDAANLRAGYAGTIGVGKVGALAPAAHTTPDCVTLHRELAQLHSSGVRALGMEVSSHALAQDRIAGVRFDTVAFTNLSRDHLDYHKTMDAYGEAKARLFALPGVEHRLINMNDPFGRRIAERLSASAPLTALWTGPGNYHGDADEFVHATTVLAGDKGLQIDFESSWGSGRLNSRLIGEFNADNLLLALGVLLLWDIPLQQAIAAVQSAGAPPGRMETFHGSAQQPVVVVDYAHSPDALAKALRASRSHCRGRLLCVFGCGGDRDAGKRPIMGALAAELADEIVLTDDNPRSEDPQRIVEEIKAGIPADKPLHVIRDRAHAIAAAIRNAAPDDLVLIAGKGHEDYQLYGDRTLHFSDREEVRRLLGGAA